MNRKRASRSDDKAKHFDGDGEVRRGDGVPVWPYQAQLQAAALAVVLLSGGYGLSGAIVTLNGASYVLAWLLAAAGVFLLWLLATRLWPRQSDDFSSTAAAAIAAVYLLALAAAYIYGAARLWQAWALPTTPSWLLLLLLAALSLYGARRGTRACLRLGLPVAFVLLLLALADSLLLLPQLSLARLGGTGAGAAVNFLRPAWRIGLCLLATLPAFLLLAPPAQTRATSATSAPSATSATSTKSATLASLRRSAVVGAAVGLVYLLLVALRAALLLGPLLRLQPYPILRSLMLAQAGPGLSRLEWWGVLALSGAMCAAAMSLTARAGELWSQAGQKQQNKAK